MQNCVGYAILDKPCEITSHQFLASITKSLGMPHIKAGHAGTLDSFATGLLICLFGSYTRLSDFFMCTKKVYEADVMFGEETDTLDPSGLVIGRGGLPSFSDVHDILDKFRGDILQAPPAFSAVHVNGKRAHELARSGKAFEIKPRPVTINSIELLDYKPPIAKLHVECSKGTYIRSLARDIGLALGTRARLNALRRTSSGPFSVNNAVSSANFSSANIQLLAPSTAASMGLGTLKIDKNESRAFVLGHKLYKIASFNNDSLVSPLAVFTEDGLFLGLAVKKASVWSYACVLPNNSMDEAK